MKKFELHRDNYVFEKKLKIERLELDNIIAFEYYKNDMSFLINSFNKEYNWDDMFDIKEVENRIKKGHILFILYYDVNPIGYVWFKEIDNNNCYLYNLYVTRQSYRPDDSPIWFVNEVSSIMFNQYSTIQCDCEDWHINAQNLFIKSGFKEV